MNEKNKREFTDEDFSLPTPTVRPYAPPAKRDTDAVSVGRDSAEKNATSGGFRIPPAGRDAASSRNIRTSHYSRSGASYSRPVKPASAEETVDFEYTCTGPLIRHVTVRSWPSSYSFYEKFVSDAHISHKKEAAPAPHVPFFSYIPQYTQLRGDQWSYYLYMRDQLHRGIALRDADFSYVLLYIYEVINLEGVYTPKDGAEALARAWSLYRSIHPMLDKYMSEWLADYCLVFRTPLPKAVYSFLPDAASRGGLKEFYLDAAIKAGKTCLGPVIRAALSDYSPEKGRYGKSDKDFALEVESVFDEVICELMSRGESIFAPSLVREVQVNRDAYCGSLCSSSAKKRLTLTLNTFLRSAESRRLVTELMKSCENIVRARRGIKARLSAPSISSMSLSAVAKTEEEARYLAFYDSPADELTPERAAEIEEASWQNTVVLTDTDASDGDYDYEDELPAGAVSYYGEAEEPSTEASETVEDEATSESNTGDDLASVLKRTDARLIDILVKTADGGSFGELCRMAGLFADDAAARINEAATDLIGDVVLELSGTEYRFVEDYRDEIGG